MDISPAFSVKDGLPRTREEYKLRSDFGLFLEALRYAGVDSTLGNMVSMRSHVKYWDWVA